MGDLNQLRELVYCSDNHACFIERDRILARLKIQMQDYTGADKYALILSKLLAEVSTPVYDCDFFAGRVVEALPEEGMEAPNQLLSTTGHMSYDYQKLLTCGLGGILAEIRENAQKKGDEDSLMFARNAEIVIFAIRDYVNRYALEAQKNGSAQMAQALRKVPYEPAYDFYSALQSVWIIHMIASCYVGSRDYAFGRFDQYLLPFYEQAIREGATEDQLTELLAGFFMKTNEICGRGTHNYRRKPVPCQASKQYICIGAERPNAFSSLVLKAAELCNMAQPQFTVLLKPEADQSFTRQVFHAMEVLTDKLHIYHYDLVVNSLIARGVPEAIAKEVTFSGCCTMDLHYHTYRMEHYVQLPQLFLGVLHKQEYHSLAEITETLTETLRAYLQRQVNRFQKGLAPEVARQQFVLDALLLSDSAKECRYACDGNAPYNIINFFCPGLATIGDSLMVLDWLVFQEQRYTYSEFMRILSEDYVNHEALRKEILNHVRFGNDTQWDTYTVLAANICADAVDRLVLRPNFFAMPGYYSLQRENAWADLVGATPDGRNSGEPFSENQSPTYGADKNGITALLSSLAKLPFHRASSGGLNLTFSRKPSAEILQAIVLSYFEMGGLHVGISVIDRRTLQDAMVHPERYRSLTVRLYGFSEYFISLPVWQQEAVLNRTEYCT